MFRLLLSAFVLIPSMSARDQGSIDVSLAKRFFQEAKWASDDDGSKMWGKPVYGPLMLVDRNTGDVVANEPDKEGRLSLKDGLYIGKLPGNVPTANTALDWAGIHWSAVLWPLPGSVVIRTRLTMHESWHRIQESIGLPAASVKNEHLDTLSGRTWLLMEFRALSKALPAWGQERKKAIEDALAFRAYRRSLFPGAAETEDRHEMNEGLAEYTGVALSGMSNSAARFYMAGRLKVNALKQSLSYAFAYETGPAYGLLLDMDSETWRKDLTPRSSLSDLLSKANHLPQVGQPTEANVRARLGDYGGEELIRAEVERDRKNKEQLATFRKTMVDGPVLQVTMPLGQYTFDPNAVFPLGAEGTVYPGGKVIDAWGVLDASEGAILVSRELKTARVSAPKGSDLAKGDGWTLRLNPGWKVVPGARKGDLVLAKE